MLLGMTLTVIVLFVAGYGYLHTAKFGAFPTGERLEKIKNSPNYRDGEFRNTEPIPISTEKSSMLPGRAHAGVKTRAPALPAAVS